MDPYDILYGPCEREFKRYERKYFPRDYKVTKKYHDSMRNCIIQFLRWVDKRKNPGAIRYLSKKHYFEYLEYLSKKLKPTTIQKHKKALRKFFLNAGLDIPVYTGYKNKKPLISEKKISNILKNIKDEIDYCVIYYNLHEYLNKYIKDENIRNNFLMTIEEILYKRIPQKIKKELEEL